MDYKDIIKNIGKYHYILVVGKKVGILGSNNKLNIAKNDAIKYIDKKNDKLENQFVVMLKLTLVSNKLLKENKEAEIKTIGGPIQINIDFYKIKNNDIVKIEDYEKDNKLFITDSFLEKNKKIGEDIIKLIASSAHNNKLNTELFVINKIDKLVKN